MYGGAEHAAAVAGRQQSPFLGLAQQSGFSVRECQIAAAAGGDRLVSIIRAAELRRTPREAEARQVRRRLLELRRRAAALEAR